MSERQYQQSHPWLKFASLDLTRAPADLWTLLGEARSKIEHLRGVPLRPEAQRRMQEVYLAKGVWATTAIEGNTLTEEDVLAHIQGKLQLPPSREYQQQEIANIIEAVNVIAGEPPQDVTPGMLAEFNRQVLKGLTLEPEVVPGEYRTYSVAAGPYVGAPAEDVPYLVQRLCDWLNRDLRVVVDEGAEDYLIYVIVRAVLAHLYFEWIHPFGDGNGRTGRLLEFQMLVSAGVPFPAAHLLSNHYNLTRTDYYRQLHNASKSGGDFIPFIRYAARGFVDGLRQQIHYVQEEQMAVMWENFVHDSVSGSTAAAHRRRTIALELSRNGRPVKRADLMTFTPKVAKEYSGKTSKTLTRDIGELRGHKLIRFTTEGYVANIDLMRAFLPGRIEPPKAKA